MTSQGLERRLSQGKYLCLALLKEIREGIMCMVLGWSVLCGVMVQRIPRTSGSNAICIVKIVHDLHVTSQSDFDVEL